MTQNNQEKVSIEISKELYDAIQQLKQIFTQLTGQQVNSDEDVIGILVSGFIQSLVEQWWQSSQQQWWENQWSIILQ